MYSQSVVTLIYKAVELEEYNYLVVALFSNKGNIPTNVIRKCFKSFKSSGLDDLELGFSTLEDMDEFCTDLMAAIKAKNAYVLSVEDFNVGLESAGDKSALTSIPMRCGRALLEEKSDGKKDLVKRLFSR